MADKNIIILDSDFAHMEFFNPFFEEEGIKAHQFNSIADYLDNESERSVLLFLLDYGTILAAERTEVIRFFQNLHQAQTVVYNVPENANRRLAFYDLGALRVYDTSYSLEEVHFSLRWLINALSAEQQNEGLYSRGRLEDLSVTNLILLLGRENRTGVLRLLSNNNSGKIYFFDGNVDAAQVGPHQQMAAVLHMLLWGKGTFIFSGSDHMAQETTINLSNYGLIILAEEYRKKLRENLQALGSEKSVLRVRNVGDLMLSDVDIKKDFIERIRRPHTLTDILENPYYTSFETAEKLVLLKQKGFLAVNHPIEHVLETSASAVEEKASAQLAVELSPEKINELRSNLNIDAQQSSAKIIVLYSPQSEKSDMVKLFIPAMMETPAKAFRGVTQLSLAADCTIYLLGVAIEQKSLDFILNLGLNEFDGYLFLIDATQGERFEYISYVMNRLLSGRALPAVAAVNGLDEQETPEKIERQFIVSGKINWIVCPQEQKQALSEVLGALKRPVEKEQEQTAEAKAASTQEQAEQTAHPAALQPEENEPGEETEGPSV